MKNLFVDTSGWMAMADSSDPVHVDCLTTRDKWLELGGMLITTDYVVDETLTLIRMRLGIHAAEKWWGIYSGSSRCMTERVTVDRIEKSVQWFFKWQDHAFSFTDCTSFVVMRELRICSVLTTDGHFTRAGFKKLPEK